MDIRAGMQMAGKKHEKHSLLFKPGKNPDDCDDAEQAFDIVTKAADIMEDPDELSRCRELGTESKAQSAILISGKKRSMRREGMDDGAKQSTSGRLAKALWFAVTQVTFLGAVFFGCLGVWATASSAYKVAVNRWAPVATSTSTGAYPVLNASDHGGKSRKRRAQVPWMTDVEVPVIKDEYTRRLKIDGINERMGISLRPVRDNGVFPDGLPHWFSEFLFRKGEDLGPRGHTRLVATENCDMIAVKQYQNGLSPKSQQEIPSRVLRQYQSPLLPVYFGFVTDAHGVVWESMEVVGPSIIDLMELGIGGKRITLHQFWWFTNIISQVLRYLDHVQLLRIPYKSFDGTSMMVRLKNPLNSDGTSLSFDDRFIPGRMHLATISDEDELRDIESITTGGRYDPAVIAEPSWAGAPGPDQQRQIEKSQLARVITDFLAVELDANGKLVESKLAPALRPYREYVHRFIAHLYYIDEPLVQHQPSPAGARFYKLMRLLRREQGRPNEFYRYDVVLNPAFVGSVEELHVVVRFYDNGRVVTEKRTYYPSLAPFASIQCHLHANEPRTLCRVSDLEKKIKNIVPKNVPSGSGAAQGGGKIGVFCQDANDYVYPGEWDKRKCSEMLKRKSPNTVISEHRGALPLRIVWCNLPQQTSQTVLARWMIRLDSGPGKLTGEVYTIKCCGYVREGGRKVKKCDEVTDKPRPFVPWPEDLFFAVDDLLVQSDRLADPRYEETAPLIERINPVAGSLPKRWEDLYPPALRTHLENQRNCMAKSTKTADITGPRTIPKHVFLSQQYMVPTTTNQRKHLWLFWNLRWSNFQLPSGERMDRCGSEVDVAEWVRFCLERGYECKLWDGDFTVDFFIQQLLSFATNFVFESFTLTLMTHGHKETLSRKEYAYFPNADGKKATQVNIDELLDEYLVLQQFVGRFKYVQIGTCRAASVKAAFHPVLETHVVKKFPDVPRRTPETYTDILHDTARTRRFIVKGSSDKCDAEAGQRGSHFLQQYFKAAREHPEMTVTELWHLVQARLTRVAQPSCVKPEWDSYEAHCRTGRQSVEITTDTTAHPGISLPLPVTSINDKDLDRIEAFAPEKRFQWVDKTHCRR